MSALGLWFHKVSTAHNIVTQTQVWRFGGKVGNFSFFNTLFKTHWKQKNKLVPGHDMTNRAYRLWPKSDEYMRLVFGYDSMINKLIFQTLQHLDSIRKSLIEIVYSNGWQGNHFFMNSWIASLYWPIKPVNKLLCYFQNQW